MPVYCNNPYTYVDMYGQQSTETFLKILIVFKILKKVFNCHEEQ